MTFNAYLNPQSREANVRCCVYVGNTLLGSGAFGVVQKGVIYYGENRQDVVAVKTVNSPKDVTDFESSLMELTIMSYIGNHEHIVSLRGACTDNLIKSA